MESGRSNNSILAERLDNLSLPANSSFDREATWKRLHDRLQDKKRRQRRKVFAWSLSVPIAASLFYLLFLFENNRQEVKKTVPIVVSPKSPTITTHDQKVATTRITIPEMPKNTVHLPVIDKNNHGNIQDIKEPADNVAAIVIETTPSSIDTNISSASIAAAPVARKKLRVIHNNELEGLPAVTGIEPNTVARVNASRFFPGFRKTNANNFEEISDDTIKKQKTRISLLPFSSLVSQKE